MDARHIHDADQAAAASATADPLIGHIEEIVRDLRRTREQIEESAIVAAARILLASQSVSTPAAQQALIARAMALLSMKGPAQLLERLQSDLLFVRDLPKGR